MHSIIQSRTSGIRGTAHKRRGGSSSVHAQLVTNWEVSQNSVVQSLQFSVAPGFRDVQACASVLRIPPAIHPCSFIVRAFERAFDECKTNTEFFLVFLFLTGDLNWFKTSHNLSAEMELQLPLRHVTQLLKDFGREA